jgi:hypothetical protein
MIDWRRCCGNRATGTVVPPAAAVEVVSLSPHRFCPGSDRSTRPMSFTGPSAVRTGRAAPSFLAARSHRAFARKPYRSEALVPSRSGRSAGTGQVSRTGRTPRGDDWGTTDRTLPGGPVLSTGRGFRPISCRPYRTAGRFQSVPGRGSYRLVSCAGHARFGGFGGRSTTRDCSGCPSPASAVARQAHRGRRPPLNPGVRPRCAEAVAAIRSVLMEGR